MNDVWKYEITERHEPMGPDVWRIYSTKDDSYEATICELWSGQHDNEALAKYICDLHNEAKLPPMAKVLYRLGVLK